MIDFFDFVGLFACRVVFIKKLFKALRMASFIKIYFMINVLEILVFFIRKVLVLRKKQIADFFKAVKEDLLVKSRVDLFGILVVSHKQVVF